MAGTHRTPESWLSSRKLARMAALSFCTTARSSAMVFAARTFRMNCFTGAISATCGRLGSRAWHTGSHCGGLKDPTGESGRRSAGRALGDGCSRGIRRHRGRDDVRLGGIREVWRRRAGRYLE